MLSASGFAAGRVRFRRIVNLARLHDIGLVVVSSIAVDINLHYYLVRLAVALITGVETQTVLAPQQRVDGTEDGGQLAFKSYRKVSAAAFFGESLHRVICLQESHPVDWNASNATALARVHAVT